MKVGVIYDSLFERHDPGYGHPERPERLLALKDLVLGPTALDGLTVLGAQRSASSEDLARVHSPEHIARINGTRGMVMALDPDTHTSEESFDAAMRSVGAGLDLLDAVRAGTFDTAFAMVRPPGHHAEADRAMGFCMFNNVAVVARYAREVHGYKRVMVIDWDVHHGNGTQHIFEHDPSVLYFSSHRFPFYPGTGAVEEIGQGAGRYTTVNVPLPAGAGDAEFLHVFRDVVEPTMKAYRPDCVLVSAGFDAHRDDPLGGMRVNADCFGQLAVSVASTVASLGGKVPLLFLLEGGYDLDGLRDSVASVLVGLRDEGAKGSSGPESSRLQPRR